MRFIIGLESPCFSLVLLIFAFGGVECSDAACNDVKDSDKYWDESTEDHLNEVSGNIHEEDWEFGYDDDNGPHVWPEKVKTCGGNRQSPIDLDTTKAITEHHPYLYWWNYNTKPMRMFLENNGHTVKLTGQWENPWKHPYVWTSSGIRLQQIYAFEQLHFHWGRNSSEGSEHTINSVRYPLEMHVVHRKKLDLDFPNDNEILVVGILFKISEHNNTALDPITSMLRNVEYPKSETEIKPVELRRFLPEFRKYFFMYNGSLTTPPCTETVSWVVKMATSTISLSQLSEFQKVRNSKNETMPNYRPTQPLNNRRVWRVK